MGVLLWVGRGEWGVGEWGVGEEIFSVGGGEWV